MSKQNQATDRPAPPDFAELIATIARGTTNAKATEALHELVRACAETGQKGSITLKITIGSQGGVAEVKPSLSMKKPEAKLLSGVYYTTESGELCEEDPKQMQLPMARAIDVPNNVRDINSK